MEMINMRVLTTERGIMKLKFKQEKLLSKSKTSWERLIMRVSMHKALSTKMKCSLKMEPDTEVTGMRTARKKVKASNSGSTALFTKGTGVTTKLMVEGV